MTVDSPHPLWDWPTRLFHWSLVVLIPLAWWTAEEGQMERHQWYRAGDVSQLLGYCR